MQLSDAIRKRIKNLLKINNMNIWKLYKATGVSASTLSYFMSGKRELINLKTLLHICEGFKITLKEFFDDPLFIDVEQD
ncbi:helix-turn-helix domain-containing protein [Romboutsia ilealis]|uniref:helix-turn-helix domain-containing protein n=1 Tax=Romboutsia ilealis TaxID=1115758 RepID=UPI00259C8E9D|nr:helix-turn-helix transcriptional regulator [Romboutsia ilealis]